MGNGLWRIEEEEEGGLERFQGMMEDKGDQEEPGLGHACTNMKTISLQPP